MRKKAHRYARLSRLLLHAFLEREKCRICDTETDLLRLSFQLQGRTTAPTGYESFRIALQRKNQRMMPDARRAIHQSTTTSAFWGFTNVGAGSKKPENWCVLYVDSENASSLVIAVPINASQTNQRAGFSWLVFFCC